MSSATAFRLRRLYPWIGAAVFALAAFLVWRALRHYSLEQIRASLDLISLRNLALGALFTAGSFLCLSGTDTLAVRYTGRRLPYRKIALASFVSLSIGHTLGFAGFSSGAVRYRFYSAWGLSAGDVARILVFCGLTVLLGLTTLGGIACLLGPRPGRPHLRRRAGGGDRGRASCCSRWSRSMSCSPRWSGCRSGSATSSCRCRRSGWRSARSPAAPAIS